MSEAIDLSDSEDQTHRLTIFHHVIRKPIMNKQRIKQAIDASNDQSVIEADINLYQSDIKQQAASVLAKIATESKRLKRPKVKIIAILME